MMMEAFMKGMYALEFEDDRPQFQYIIAQVSGNYALVFYLSWIDGCPTYGRLIKLDEIHAKGWHLYEHSEDLSRAVKKWEQEAEAAYAPV